MTEAREFRRLGPYLLVQTSGSGGMGRIELAVRSGAQSSDVCVIKRMHANTGAEDQEARFRREAQIAARLEHDAIARTLRVEDIDGEVCLAQEYVEGVNAGRLMRQCRPRPLPANVAAHVVREVCRGLGYAHDFGGLGIVHRDVTPENIMISFSGDVKLIDFGIARSTVDGTLTNVGVVVGRREYIAPEAWEGERADRRADIYALGVVLWELLTGLRLEGSSDVGPGKQPPNPCSVNAAIPPELGDIVLRALAADAGARYQSAGELREALAPFVPADPDPKTDLAALLRFYFNVDLMQGLIAEDIADARRFLESSKPRRTQGISARRGVVVAAGAAAAVVLVGAVVMRRAPARALSPTPEAALAATTPATLPGAPPAQSQSEIAAHTGVAPTPVDEPSRLGRVAPAVRVERRARRDAEAPVGSAPVTARSPDELVREAQTQWDRGNDPAAIALLRQARGGGAGASAHVLLGAILMSEGKVADAERELAEAVRLDPGNAQAKGLLAVAREKTAERGR